MTTSVENVVRLDLGDALAANPAGLFAVLTAVALLVLRPTRIAVPGVALPLALSAMWVFQLHRFDVF